MDRAKLGTVLGITCLAAAAGCRGRSSEVAAPSKESEVARRHIGKLREGEYGLGSQRYPILREPLHVKRLVELGPGAGQVLVEALRDGNATPLSYCGQLSFRTHSLAMGSGPHRATVGDIADYVLRAIYGMDVGYRSYLDAKRREEAMARWREAVAGMEGDAPVTDPEQ